VAIWYIFPRFGIPNKENSGNPAHNDEYVWLIFLPKRCELYTAAKQLTTNNESFWEPILKKTRLLLLRP
jgi:hypothetical protein